MVAKKKDPHLVNKVQELVPKVSRLKVKEATATSKRKKETRIVRRKIKQSSDTL